MRSGSESRSAVDRSGREISVRPPTALDTLRLFKAAGPILSQNESWLSIASLAACVVAIDSVPVPAPTSEAQIEAIVARLGDDGLETVNKLLGPPANSCVDPDAVGN